MNTGMLLWSFFIGTIGLGYVMYGKKSPNMIALFSGMAMMIYPYFVENIFISIIVGVILFVLPFVL